MITSLFATPSATGNVADGKLPAAVVSLAAAKVSAAVASVATSIAVVESSVATTVATVTTVTLTTAEAAVVEAALATEAALWLTRNAITLAGNVGSAAFALAIIELNIVGNRLTFVQRLEAICVDCGEVDEDIISTVSRSDEAKTLLWVEELDGTLKGHNVIFEKQH